VRIAIVSDIHGNRTAFEAVVADLRITSPDMVLHGGDLADGGSGAVEIVDRIRDFGWQGVVGNTDEMLFRPQSLVEFAKESPKLESLFAAIEEMAVWTREALGEARLAWLRGLPRKLIHDHVALVHASPESLWRAPAHTAGDAELGSVYAPLGQAVAIYGHIHWPFIRSVAGARGASKMLVANSGSVGLSYDGDRRAAYLLVDESGPAIRRVEYDVDRELKAVRGCRLPHAEWLARMLESGSAQMP
jgi:predicted phosphodiesterase